jgi:hypothetical protein
MTLQEYLAAEGLTSEEIAAVVGNEKQSKAMTKALGLADEGRTLKQQAEAEKLETASYWEQKTKELEGSVTRLTSAEKLAAASSAEAARTKAYLKSLADQGYDVPKEMYEGVGSVTPNPSRDDGNGRYITREDMDKSMRSTAPDLVSLTALSNEYYSLYGKPYVEVEQDFQEAQKAGRPLRDYARSKYNFEGKKQELATAADQKRIDEIVAEKMKTRETELAAKYGSNPELRSPLPSKFDKLTKSEGFKNDSWKSQEGRDSNRNSRLKKFENISIQ